MKKFFTQLFCKHIYKQELMRGIWYRNDREAYYGVASRKYKYTCVKCGKVYYEIK